MAVIVSIVCALGASIKFESNPTGLAITVDGASYRTPTTLEWVPGSMHSVSFGAIIGGSAGIRYQFLRWMDSGDPYTRTITTGSANGTYSAVFTTQYLATVVANPARGGTVSGGGWFDAGARVTIEAVARDGYRFTGFGGDVTRGENPVTLEVTRPLKILARFARK
jgi:hypothetical protein